ncbi:hypothetical protein HELRODRAFT_176785 [Helobdella robusta]|uniref:Uncharacterized protein n=1 Tax=Helobdella robusta TaxID=6412 RepID=T1FAW8_HELRO|nr:hypothetical protein HELRODRAFT_176785 [Helobdella robusta]ESN99616.1 hypothetical protein HELRODRAFT_176785 [Helobdella robusta]
MRLFSIGRRRVVHDPMVDIEGLLIHHAWTEIADPNIFDRIFKNKKFQLEVNWSHLDISHQLTSFRIRNRSGTDQIIGGSSFAQKSKSQTTSEKLRSKVLRRDLCLFRTEFTNTSDEAQTFTFKTERKTTSRQKRLKRQNIAFKIRCDISIQQGFRIGGNVDIRVSIPTTPAGMLPKVADAAASELDTCRITGGLSGELHVTKATGQTIEENLTWGVDSQVNVEPKSRVVAALMIREEELTADFVITTTIRAIHSVVQVYIKDKKTKRLLEILEIPAKNLADILGSDRFSKLENNVVQCDTKGNIKAVYGAEQVIRVDSYKDLKGGFVDGEAHKFDSTLPTLATDGYLVEEA